MLPGHTHMSHKKKCTKSAGAKIRVLAVMLALTFFVNNLLTSLLDFAEQYFYNMNARTVLVTLQENEDAPLEDIRKSLLAYLDGCSESLSYTENVGITVETEELGRKAAVPYDYEAISPYLLTEGCEELEVQEAVIAKYITTGDITDAQDEVVDGEQFVGQTIPCTVYANDGTACGYEIRIVGIYDNVAAGVDHCLLMREDEVTELVGETEPGYIMDDDENIIGYMYESAAYCIVLKNYEDLDAFSQSARELEGVSGVYSQSSLDATTVYIGYVVAMILYFLMIVVTFNASANIIYITEEDIRRRRREFGLLKSIGYRDRAINWLLFRETAMDIVKSLLPALVAGCLALAAAQVWKSNNLNIYYRTLRFAPHMDTLCLTLGVGICAPMMGFFAGMESLSHISSVHAMQGME